MARKTKEIVENKTEKVTVDTSLQQEVNLSSFSAEYRSRCGGTLRATREKLGLTTQEVASQLRLSSKQIEALEADNFLALPESTIVKGFIRNYAKLLKISAEPLLDAYNVLVPGKSPQSFTLNPNIKMKVTGYEKPKTKRYVVFGLALALGFSAWLFYQNYVQKPSPVTPTAELTQPGVPEPLPEVALPAAERSVSETSTQLTLPGNETTAGQTESVNTATATEKPQETVATTATTSPIAPQPPVVQTPPVQTSLSQTTPSQAEGSNGKSKLEFNATQETWISVTDANGNQIYNRTLFAGNRETVEAKPPLKVIVGNALGATLEVNGKAVDLAPHTRVNVAHIQID